jgi:hypothetical protein
MPPLFDFAPGGVCRATCVTTGAVRTYCTGSTLPRQSSGGVFSVALSLNQPLPAGPPGVTRHRSSLEPGLSSKSAIDGFSGRPALWKSRYTKGFSD